MKYNRTRLIFCSLISAVLFISGCANKKSRECYTENSDIVSPYTNESYAPREPFQEPLQHDTCHFNFDCSAILEKDYPSLDAFAASCDNNDDHIVIYGHTDQIGTRSYNLALGERRANSVKDYLVQKGIDASRIEVISYGFEKPIMPGFTKEACAANRRVQFITK